MFVQILFASIIICALTLAGFMRRSEGLQRGYLFLVAGVMSMGVVALGQSSQFLGIGAIALTALTIVIPWILELLSRTAFTRNKISWAVRLASWRAMLMPGSGLGEQQSILAGLAIFEKSGADAAINYFRGLSESYEDPGQLALVHEQIVSMMFQARRWEEGISHYEQCFQPGYASLRPALALGLLRAFGESEQLDRAANLLRGLENSQFANDPRAGDLLGQARLTFLAYAGAEHVVRQVVADDRGKKIGLSSAAAMMFHGIALARAGQSHAAADMLSRVESVAGPQEIRVIEASRAALEHLRSAAVDLDSGLRNYVEGVAERLELLLRSSSDFNRGGGVLTATHGLMIAGAFIFGVQAMLNRGGVGLVKMGLLTPEIWAQGAWERVFTAGWIHTDIFSLVLDLYAIWIGGQIVERAYGAARVVWIVVGGTALSLAIGAWQQPLSAGIQAGSLAAVGIIVAAMLTLLPSRSPQITFRSRRNILLTLSLLLVANLIGGVSPTILGDAPIVAFAVCVCFSALMTLKTPKSISVRIVRAVFDGGAILLICLSLAGALRVHARDVSNPLLAGKLDLCHDQGMLMPRPSRFRWIDAETELPLASVPLIGGLVDTWELRSGGLVQLAGIHYDDHLSAKELALFAAHRELKRRFAITETSDALPKKIAVAMSASDHQWRVRDLRSEGVVVARVIERRMEQMEERSRSVVLIASPPESLEHAPELYARMLSESSVTETTSRSPPDSPSELKACNPQAPEFEMPTY